MYQHLSLDEWLNISAPYLGPDDWTFDRCKMFNLTSLDKPLRARPVADIPVIQCMDFEYDDQMFQVN